MNDHRGANRLQALELRRKIIERESVPLGRKRCRGGGLMEIRIVAEVCPEPPAPAGWCVYGIREADDHPGPATIENTCL